MIILGIDPGAATGWCLYASASFGLDARVLASGEFPGSARDAEFEQYLGAPLIVFESFREPRGLIYPQVVQAAIIEGELAERMRARHPTRTEPFVCLSRHEIKMRLTAATLNEIVCRKDKDVWRALQLLHGDDCAKKGGRLYGVRAHARAALAACVAVTLPPAPRPPAKVGAKATT